MSRYIHAITIGLLIGVLGFGFEDLRVHHPRLFMIVAGAFALSGVIVIFKGAKRDR